MYGLSRSPCVAFFLMLLGMALTVLLWSLAERDQLHRQRSLDDSRVRETNIDDIVPWYLKLKGGETIRIVFGLLLFSDLFLMGWLLCNRPRPPPKDAASASALQVSPAWRC